MDANNSTKVTLILLEDDIDGPVQSKNFSWNGVAYKIPRPKLKECESLPNINNSGVYLLLERSKATGEEFVYIGQAGERENDKGLLNRVLEHKKDMDDWIEAVMITKSDESLEANDISYFEYRFYEMAKEAGRFKLTNKKKPTSGMH